MSNGRSALSRTPLLLVLAAALAAPGCQPSSPKTAPEAQPKTAAQAPNGAAPAASGSSDLSPAAQAAIDRAKTNAANAAKAAPTELEPPDGKWLTDEKGKQYFVYELPRIENTYQWIEEGKTIRVRYGLVLDVVSYDEKTFRVKYYRPEQQAQTQRPQLTQEERDRVAATYKSALRSGDRLRFEPISEGLPAQGQWRQGFDLADINGDGHLDIVHGPARKSGSKPAIFLSDGKGGWSRWSEVRVPAVPFDYGDAAVGDLNGDGKADLVLASHLRGISAMVGDGKGGFTLWSQGIQFAAPDQTGGPTAFSSRAITVVDWNRDGKPDILAIGEGPSFTPMRGASQARTGESRGAVVYLNNGDGTWTRKNGGAGTFSDAVVVADVNGDSRPDFVTGSGQVGIKTIVNYGREDGSWDPVNVPQVRSNAVVRSVATADFNGDGRLDLALGYSSNEAGVWRTGVDVLFAVEAASGWQRQTLAAEESQSGLWSLATGDLDGDGATDIVGLDGDGKGWVFLGDGKGSFVREESPEIQPADGGACRGYHAILADLDGDGRSELVADFSGEGQDNALAGTALPTCPSGGSLRAWKVAVQPGKGKK